MKRNGLIVLTIMLLLLLTISNTGLALSPDEATAIVSVKNNYLMSGETTSVVNEMITYNGQKYIVVAASNGTTVTAYIPIKNSDGNIASQDVELRETIKTAIIFTKMTSLKDSTTPANWPFSYSTKNFFYDLSTDFSGLMNDAQSIETILNAIGTSEALSSAAKAQTVQTKTDSLVKQSKLLSTQIDNAMKSESDFLNSPDTNEATKYETTYKNYFNAVTQYKTDFVELQNVVTQLNQEISTLDPTKLTTEQQKSYQLLLSKAPLAVSKASRSNPAKLDSYFGTNDQIRTLIEGVFNESRNSESYITTIQSRKVRNEAWKVMYGTNDALIKIDPSFVTLEKAANAILSTNNIELWANKDAVSGLQSNWSNAVTRYNNLEFEKAKDFALKAQANVKLVIDDGTVSTVDNSGQDLLIKIIAVLIILVIGVFVYQKFVSKKKPKEEEYNEP